MNSLLTFADTDLNGLHTRALNNLNFSFVEKLQNVSEEVKEKLIEELKSDFALFGKHNYYKNNELVHKEELLSFNEESRGTSVLLGLGGKLLQILESGGIVFVDELETSLHPFLSRTLVQLFQNKKINSKNAQLIFTTHDTTLLDRTLFRRDQIWITEKNEKGETDLFSLQDFSDVREDTTHFDKWYLAGKFGGVPNIKSIESLFEMMKSKKTTNYTILIICEG